MSVAKKAAALLVSREKYIQRRKAAQIVASLGALSLKWLKKDYPFRRRAARELVRVSGFSSDMAEAMLDAIFKELTPPKLARLLRSELKNPAVLDGFSQGRYAQGPGILLHIFSANLPAPAITSVVHGMLVKSANVIKSSRRDPGFLGIYLESLAGHDPSLSKTNWLLDADGLSVLKEWIGISDAVTAYGSDETITTLWTMTGPKKIFTGHGHRVSFSVYTREVMNDRQSADLARKTARDVWMADQRGCLSPSVVYVEEGGETSARDFAADVAAELERLSGCGKGLLKIDRGRVFEKEKLKVRWKLEKTAGRQACFWESVRRGEWAVFYGKGTGALPLTCGGQTIFIRTYRGTDDIQKTLKPCRAYLQAAALEASGPKKQRMVRMLSALGVNRITRAGALQSPPAEWHHDGRPNLAGWLRWTDLE